MTRTVSEENKNKSCWVGSIVEVTWKLGILNCSGLKAGSSPFEIKFDSSPLNCKSQHTWYLLQLGRRNWYYLVFTVSSGKCSGFLVSSKHLTAGALHQIAWPKSSLYAEGGTRFMCARVKFWYRCALEFCSFSSIGGRWELNTKMSENMKKFKNA